LTPDHDRLLLSALHLCVSGPLMRPGHCRTDRKDAGRCRRYWEVLTPMWGWHLADIVRGGAW